MPIRYFFTPVRRSATALFVICAFAASTDGTAAATDASTSSADPAVLQQITQQMADAVAPGDVAVWQRYTDPGLTYVSENNEVKTRSQLLEELKPLPKGFSGNIRIVDFQQTPFDGFVVTTYVMDESENVEGHQLHARYRATDTWHHTGDGWKLTASQVLAIPKDPPGGTLTAAELDAYAGEYSLSANSRMTIRRDGDHLLAQRPGRPEQILRAEFRDVFFVPGKPRTRRVFLHAADGSITGFADRREGEDLPWQRIGHAPG